MYDSKVALLGGIIDYAGTFAPASLPLEGALKRAATFRAEARHPWILGRVTLPLSDLKKITASSLYGAGADGSPWWFTALGSQCEKEDDLGRVMEWDLREILHWNERWKESSIRQKIVGYEVKVPQNALPNPKAILSRLAKHDICFYLELGWQGDWKGRVKEVGESLLEAKEFIGLKFRTGGAETPPSGELASAISLCTQFGFRFKATQGMHHAVSGSHGFGFVNAFSALSLAQVLGERDFSSQTIKDCLEDSDPSHFQFGKNSFRWKKVELSTEKIEEARRIHGGALGSCSLDEPNESLTEVFNS